MWIVNYCQLDVCLQKHHTSKYIFSLKRKTWQEQISCWATSTGWDCDAGCSPTARSPSQSAQEPQVSPEAEAPWAAGQGPDRALGIMVLIRINQFASHFAHCPQSIVIKDLCVPKVACTKPPCISYLPRHHSCRPQTLGLAPRH